MDAGLNKNQILAVKHKEGPMMVLAGPGSGKTTVITARVKYLIEHYNVQPEEILVITFTKAAAGEMKERFTNLTAGHYKVSFSTFHSFFYRIIRSETNAADILDETGRKDALRAIIGKMGLLNDDEEDFLADISNEISYVYNDMLDLKYYHSVNTSTEDFKEIIRLYEEYKQKNRKMDFDDMLIKCYELITSKPGVLDKWRRRYKHILIDEFQDINRIQYESVKLFAAPLNNLFVVGDDDQSIYKFRGARPEFLLEFPNEYKDVKSTVLDINYRSTDNIICLSGKVIEKNKKRYAKEIKGAKNQGKPPKILLSEDITQEAVTIAKKIKQFEGKLPFEEIAVIYRTNIQSRAFVDALMDLNIPFQVKDEAPSLYEHFICKDVCAYIKFALDMSDKESLVRIINRPKRYINKSFLDGIKKSGGNALRSLTASRGIQAWQRTRIEELAFYLEGIKKRRPYDAYKYIRQAVNYDEYIKEYAAFRKMTPKGLFEILDELQEGAKTHETINDYLMHVEAIKTELKKEKNKNGVVLSTMHSAKGLEYEVVFVPSAVEGVIPHEKSKTEEETEEERRLLYVAITRAKRFVYISYTKKRYEQAVKLTKFLENIL